MLEEEKSEESNALFAHTRPQPHTDTHAHAHTQQREPDGYVSLSAARPPLAHTHTSPGHTHARAHKAALEDEEVPDELVDLNAPHSAPTQHTLNALPVRTQEKEEDGVWNTFAPSPHSPHTETETETAHNASVSVSASVAQKHADLFGEGETRSAPIGWD